LPRPPIDAVAKRTSVADRDNTPDLRPGEPLFESSGPPPRTWVVPSQTAI